MITVSLNEADFEYDIHSLVKAFYPKEDVKVFADSEKIFRKGLHFVKKYDISIIVIIIN